MKECGEHNGACGISAANYSANGKISGILFPKVEKILKGSLDSIPSPAPSVKIQIMGR